MQTQCLFNNFQTSTQTVPANLARYGLSQIINHLLSLDPQRPFDFLIDGELLRVSLHKHLLARQLTTEAVLEVEYFPAVLPPTPKEEERHEDWVSAIAVLHNLGKQSGKKKGSAQADLSPVLAAGCYDGIVRLWHGGKPAQSFAAHKGPIKSAVAILGETKQLLTAGTDCTARVWQWTGSAAKVGAAAPELLAVMKGHKASVEAAAARPDGQRCVTAGWDGQVLLWRSGKALVDSVASNSGSAASGAPIQKRRRTDTSEGQPPGHHEEEAVRSLEGHTQCVSALAWPEDSTILSGSWDHSVRVWDVDVGTPVDTYLHNKAVHCMATPSAAAGGAAIIAFGGPEKSVRLWDRRSGGSSGSGGTLVKALCSHEDWVSALAWHPTSEFYLMSASYDRTAKLWDLRADIPLHTLPAAGDKLLSCAWVGSGELAVGGADCVIRTATMELAI